MALPLKPDWKFNIPSAVATATSAGIGCIIAFVVLQSKVEATQDRMGLVEVRVDRLEQAREIDRTARQTDREAILTMQGDIRVVRQILEGMRAAPAGPPR